MPLRKVSLIAVLSFAIGSATAQSVSELQDAVGEILHTTCGTAGCHAGPTPQMNLDLRRGQFVQATVGRTALTRPDLQLVHPGRPDASYLVMKIEGTEGIVGMPMPFEGDRLSADKVNTIRSWIEALGEEEAALPEAAPAERYAFLGWRAVNLPTNRFAEGSTLLATIGHRFNPRFTSGYDTFFGLDGSSVILLSLGYAPTDRLMLTLGRSNVDGNVEMNAAYLIIREETRGPPVSLSARAAVNWSSARPPGDASRLRPEAFRWSGQIVVTRAISDRGGISIVPGILLDSAVDESALVTLGMAGRWQVSRSVSLIGEWVPILTGYAPTSTFGNLNRFDSWGGAVEIATAGHVFQIVVSNSVGLATDQYLRGGDLDVREGHFRLGFNIFRVFGI